MAEATQHIVKSYEQELKRLRDPCTEANLGDYRRLLEDSFVLKDMKKYRKVPGLLHGNRQLLDLYPRMLSQAAQTWFRVDGVDKRTKERQIMRDVRQARGWRGLLGDAFKVARAWR